MVLNAALIGGFLVACLFFSHAQCDDRRGGILGAEVEEILSENLEEDCLTEGSHAFFGQVIVSEHDCLSTDRLFGPCICLTAGSTAIDFQDWMIPLRI